MAALIGTALVADLVTLPAFLAGPLGSLIEKTILREQKSSGNSLTPEQEEMLHAAHEKSGDMKSFRVVTDSNKTDSVTH